MVYIIYRCSVQQDKVLVGTSSAYIQSGGTVHSGLHSGHKLNGFHHVCLSQYAWGVFYLCHWNLYGTHLRGYCSGFSFVGNNDNFFQLRISLHTDIQQSIFGKSEFACFRSIAQIGETQFGFSFRQCDTVKAVRIGGGSLILMTLNDVTANQRLGRRPVSDMSADSKLAAYGLLSFFLFQ